MKFGEKLIELRKMKGLSREDLADKLDVSSKTISDWENNNSNPNNDKLIKISKIFNCSVDDLINEEIMDINSCIKNNNKENINNNYSILGFISDSFDMFLHIGFIKTFKCILEIIILAFLLYVGGLIVSNVFSYYIFQILSLFSFGKSLIVCKIFEIIFYYIWLALSIVAIIQAFKVRHLDYYVKEKNRDEKNTKSKRKSLMLLGLLTQLVYIIVKIFVIFLLISTLCSIVLLAILCAISIIFIPVHILFLWLAFILVSIIITYFLITSILYRFTFNLKVNLSFYLLIFVFCIVALLASTFMFSLSLSKIDIVGYKDVFDLKNESIKLDYKENLVLQSSTDGKNDSFEYIIDNSIENDKVVVNMKIDDKYFDYKKYDADIDGMSVVKIVQYLNMDTEETIYFVIDNLKKNQLYSLDDDSYNHLIVKANLETINKLIDNQKKLWLVEEDISDNKINIITREKRVLIPEELEGYYNVLNDKFSFYDKKYNCNKETKSTKYGNQLVYICDFDEED